MRAGGPSGDSAGWPTGLEDGTSRDGMIVMLCYVMSRQVVDLESSAVLWSALSLCLSASGVWALALEQRVQYTH